MAEKQNTVYFYVIYYKEKQNKTKMSFLDERIKNDDTTGDEGELELRDFSRIDCISSVQ